LVTQSGSTSGLACSPRKLDNEPSFRKPSDNWKSQASLRFLSSVYIMVLYP
jgi:hypothetical protein